jgi:hypothetical protein
MTPELGCGLTYHPSLSDFVAANRGEIDVVEIDPSPLLEESDDEALAGLAGIPCARILRGVPVGASRLPYPSVVARLRDLASALEARWVTSELAFQSARMAEAKGEDFETGLPLPLRQTIGGARIAAHSARSVASELRTRLVLRSMKNYLRPRRDEIGDGEFLAEVAEDAGSGISLDLGSLWINAANGRQRVEDFFDAIPLERVWDLRLGSGNQRSGYGFGARPGAILEALVSLAASLVPRLTSLRAIIFEIHPDSISRLGASGISKQLRVVRSLWERRGKEGAASERKRRTIPRFRHERGITSRDWEDTLGRLVVGKDESGTLAEELLRDPGLAVARRLLAESRASAVQKHLLLTTRLLTAAAGPAFFRSLLEGYWKKETPSPSAPLEALRFGRHLASLALEIPYFTEVLEYERAVIASELDGEKRVVSFRHDPEVVLRALAKGKVPGAASYGSFEVEVASA